MSPRAACQLERLGFTAVHDYTAGKADWLAAGLPTEGPGAATPRAGGVARTDVPTCRPDDTVDVARRRAADAGEDPCVVLSDTGIVLGVLHHEAQLADGQALVGDVMRAGPTTVRAHEDLGDLVERMHSRNVTEILVTDPDGHLIGMLRRDDADTALARAGMR